MSAGELAGAVDVLHVPTEVGHDGLGADGAHPAPSRGQLGHGYSGAWKSVQCSYSTVVFIFCFDDGCCLNPNYL